MAGINGPKIVTNGLVRCWDAADFKSKLNWIDLTGSGDSISVNNGYDTSNNFGGYWSFNGSFQSIAMTKGVIDALTSAPRTLEIWMNSRQSNSADTNYRGFIQMGTTESGRSFNMALRGTTELGFNKGNWTTSSDTTWQTISNGIYDRWLLFTLTYIGTTLTWYINGQSIYNQTVTLSSGNTVDSNKMTFGSYGNNTAIWIASTKFYSRGLSASEVLQNFNTTKGRFGL